MREWRGRARGARVAELEEVYRSGYRRFLRTATAILGNEDDGADAVHDAFVKAVRHRETFSRRGAARSRRGCGGPS